MPRDGGIEARNVRRVLGGAAAADATDGVDHLSGLEDVELVQVGAHVCLQILDHATNIRDVRLGVRQSAGELTLEAQGNT